MKTSIATAERLLTAIESFVEQESLWVLAGDSVRAAAVAARNAPLISRLGSLGRSDAAVCLAMSRRVDALVAKRRRVNQLHLSAREAISGGRTGPQCDRPPAFAPPGARLRAPGLQVRAAQRRGLIAGPRQDCLLGRGHVSTLDKPAVSRVET